MVQSQSRGTVPLWKIIILSLCNRFVWKLVLGCIHGFSWDAENITLDVWLCVWIISLFRTPSSLNMRYHCLSFHTDSQWQESYWRTNSNNKLSAERKKWSFYLCTWLPLRALSLSLFKLLSVPKQYCRRIFIEPTCLYLIYGFLISQSTADQFFPSRCYVSCVCEDLWASRGASPPIFPIIIIISDSLCSFSLSLCLSFSSSLHISHHYFRRAHCLWYIIMASTHTHTCCKIVGTLSQLWK